MYQQTGDRVCSFVASFDPIWLNPVILIRKMGKNMIK